MRAKTNPSKKKIWENPLVKWEIFIRNSQEL